MHLCFLWSDCRVRGGVVFGVSCRAPRATVFKSTMPISGGTGSAAITFWKKCSTPKKTRFSMFFIRFPMFPLKKSNKKTELRFPFQPFLSASNSMFWIGKRSCNDKMLVTLAPTVTFNTVNFTTYPYTSIHLTWQMISDETYQLTLKPFSVDITCFNISSHHVYIMFAYVSICLYIGTYVPRFTCFNYTCNNYCFII